MPAFVSLLLITNVIFVTLAWGEQSWGDFRLLFIDGPMINGAFLLGGLFLIPVLERHQLHFCLPRYLVLTIGLPILAVITDYLLIMYSGRPVY